MNASQRPTVLVDFTSIHVLDIDGANAADAAVAVSLAPSCNTLPTYASRGTTARTTATRSSSRRWANVPRQTTGSAARPNKCPPGKIGNLPGQSTETAACQPCKANSYAPSTFCQTSRPTVLGLHVKQHPACAQILSTPHFYKICQFLQGVETPARGWKTKIVACSVPRWSARPCFYCGM